MSSGGGGSLQRRGRGWFSEMFLRNGSQKGQMGLQRHRWQERQRIKKGQAGPLKHSLSMKWENKETKQFWRLILGGELYFPHLEIRSGGEWQSIDPYYHRSSRLSLLPWLLSTTNWFPAIIILPHKVKHLVWYQRVKLFVVFSFSRKIADAPSCRECSTSSPIWPGSCSCWWKKFLAWKTWVCWVEREKLPLWRGWAELGWCGEGAAQKKLPVWKRLTVSRGQDVKQ